jgi:hypothetical protein
MNSHALALLTLVGAVSESDAAKNRVPGLERAIPKNKWVEFGSLLHQFAIDYAASPQSAKVKQVVGEISPAAKERLPKKVATPEPPRQVDRRVPPPTPAEGKALESKDGNSKSSEGRTSVRTQGQGVRRPDNPQKTEVVFVAAAAGEAPSRRRPLHCRERVTTWLRLLHSLSVPGPT